jgi:TrmH family RNA methyltransferase
LLTQLKVEGIHTLASCVQDETKAGGVSLSPWEVDWRQPIALLVGNEGAGLPEDVVRGADARVHIPMARGVESLNAAAAAAVLFYEGYRQREKQKQ